MSGSLGADSVGDVCEVLVDCHTMNLIDTTGANSLIDLAEELRGKGIRLSLARIRDHVREAMRRNAVDVAIGEDRIYDTLTAGVEVFEACQGQPS